MRLLGTGLHGAEPLLGVLLAVRIIQIYPGLVHSDGNMEHPWFAAWRCRHVQKSQTATLLVICGGCRRVGTYFAHLLDKDKSFLRIWLTVVDFKPVCVMIWAMEMRQSLFTASSTWQMLALDLPDLHLCWRWRSTMRSRPFRNSFIQ